MESIKKIRVGNAEVGLIGLDEIFSEIRALGIEGTVLKEEILKRVKLYNWISENQEDAYKLALLKVYKCFCEELNRR